MSGFRQNLDSLLGAFQDVPESVRVLKVAEEYGEATEAYIGFRGLNPRKGKTHTSDDVADELADIAITALVAMGTFCGDPIQRLTNRMSDVARRAVMSGDAAVTGRLEVVRYEREPLESGWWAVRDEPLLEPVYVWVEDDEEDER